MKQRDVQRRARRFLGMTAGKRTKKLAPQDTFSGKVGYVSTWDVFFQKEKPHLPGFAWARTKKGKLQLTKKDMSMLSAKFAALDRKSREFRHLEQEAHRQTRENRSKLSLGCSQRRFWILVGYNDSVINRRKMAVDRGMNPVSFTGPLIENSGKL